MSDLDNLDGFEDQVAGLEQTVGQATAVTATFAGHLNDLKASMADASTYAGRLEGGFSGGLRKAFDGLAFDGMKLSDALQTVAQSMINTAYNAAMKPVTDHFGGLLAQGVGGLVTGMMPFADGGSFAQGRVMPFAKGGVVSGPMTFPMRGGTGLMGEAGPEAIMPLTRGSDGSLGVRAQGGRSVNVTMNIQTPDVAGFQRSRGQIASQMSRALGAGRRNS